jgi:hypothetical protein
MDTGAIAAFTGSLHGLWVVGVFTAILIMGIIAELLHHSKVTLQWLVYCVIVGGVVAGAAAEAQAWFGGA